MTVIGCSGSFAGPSSPASSYLVRAQADGRTWSIVLDLGSGALGALQRHTDPRAVDAVFITHLHPDHCLDLTGMYVVRHYHPDGPAAASLPVHGPRGTRERIQAAYEGMGESGMGEEVDFRVIRDGSRVRVGPLLVTAFAVHHPIEAYGYRVEADGTVLAYTGDTDDCVRLQDLCAGADLMLADAAFVDGRDVSRGIHLTGSRAAQVAVAAGAKRLMLTHLPAWNDPEVCRAQAATIWPGTVELAGPDATYEI